MSAAPEALTVNGALDFVWDERPLVERLMDVRLIQEELEREPIEVSEAELRRAMDSFRRARRLVRAPDDHGWTDRRESSRAQVESVVADAALMAKLRRRIAAGRVEAYFQAHQFDFDSVHIARIAFASESEARAAGELVRGSDLDFYALADRQFVAGARHPAAGARNLAVGASFEVVRRGDLAPQAAAAILLASQNDLVGPVWDGQGFILALILLHTPARLDAPTTTTIERLLFETWLEERRTQGSLRTSRAT